MKYSSIGVMLLTGACATPNELHSRSADASIRTGGRPAVQQVAVPQNPSRDGEAGSARSVLTQDALVTSCVTYANGLLTAIVDSETASPGVLDRMDPAVRCAIAGEFGLIVESLDDARIRRTDLAGSGAARPIAVLRASLLGLEVSLGATNVKDWPWDKDEGFANGQRSVLAEAIDARAATRAMLGWRSGETPSVSADSSSGSVPGAIACRDAAVEERFRAVLGIALVPLPPVRVTIPHRSDASPELDPAERVAISRLVAGTRRAEAASKKVVTTNTPSARVATTWTPLSKARMSGVPRASRTAAVESRPTLEKVQTLWPQPERNDGWTRHDTWELLANLRWLADHLPSGTPDPAGATFDWLSMNETTDMSLSAVAPEAEEAAACSEGEVDTLLEAIDALLEEAGELLICG